jgi:hypothetical protein
VTSTEASQRAAAHALQVEIPTAVVAANSPDPSAGDGSLQADLDTAARADAKSLVPEGGHNPAGGSGSHVGGAPGAGDPPVHYGPGAWLL